MSKQQRGQDLIGNEYIFPQSTNYYPQKGLTKRELFAAIALHGLMTSGAIPRQAVIESWEIADRMIEQGAS